MNIRPKISSKPIDKLEIREANVLVFDIDVAGAVESQVDARFVIVGERFDLSFNMEIDKGKAQVKLPPLNELLDPGVAEVKVEAVVNGARFISPMSGAFEFVEKVNIDMAFDESKSDAPNVNFVRVVSTKDFSKILEESDIKVEGKHWIKEHGEEAYVFMIDHKAKNGYSCCKIDRSDESVVFINPTEALAAYGDDDIRNILDPH